MLIIKSTLSKSIIAPAEDTLLDTYTHKSIEMFFINAPHFGTAMQLSWGKYWDVTFPKTNTVSERDVAHLRCFNED